MTVLLTPVVTEGLVGSLQHRRRPQTRERADAPPTGSPQLVAEGHSMKEIAALLNLAPRTGAFHKYRMMEQLHVKSTAHAVTHDIV